MQPNNPYQSTQIPHNAPQQQVIVGTPVQYQPVQVGAYGAPVVVGMGGPDNTLRIVSWILVLIGFLGGFACGAFCFLIPIGLIPEAIYLHQSINWKNQVGLNTAGDIISLVLLYIILIITIIAPFYFLAAIGTTMW
jgi:hypothetical protein